MDADEEPDKRLETLLRHIENVQKNCLRLGTVLIEEKNEEELGRKLIANGMIHDNSKFSGIEWEYFHPEAKEKKLVLFNAAWRQHVSSNPHHPEYWSGGIQSMPEVYLAEMVCDWLARSTEFGDNIWEWTKDKAADRYKYSTSGRVYKDIKRYLEFILEPAFK